MNYIYFISFSYQKNTGWGFGCIEVLISNPITSFNQLAEIVQRIQNEENLMGVTLLYFTLLRTEEKD